MLALHYNSISPLFQAHCKGKLITSLIALVKVMPGCFVAAWRAAWQPLVQTPGVKWHQRPQSSRLHMSRGVVVVVGGGINRGSVWKGSVTLSWVSPQKPECWLLSYSQCISHSQGKIRRRSKGKPEIEYERESGGKWDSRDFSSMGGGWKRESRSEGEGEGGNGLC